MPFIGISTILTVRYNANGGSGAPSSHSHIQNGDEYPIYNTITLSDTTPTRSGYFFCGWATSASATEAQYAAGGNYTYVFAGSTKHTTTLYAVWGTRITYTPGQYGTGTTKHQYKPLDATVKLKDALFTRQNYMQVGWHDGTNDYALGGRYSANANITLYPRWKASNSTIASLSANVEIGATNGGSLTLTRYDSNYMHQVVITYGTKSLTLSNVGSSTTFTIPDTWLPELPNATSGVATCTVKTFEGSTLIGSAVSKTFTIKVAASVKPTVSLSGVNQSSNGTVNGWGVLVQGYSTIKLTATASAGTGATIQNIAFTGDGVNQSGTGTTVTSSILNNSGSRSWTCTVTDSRGRSASYTLTRTVHPYGKPTISSFSALRALQDGTVNESEGTYIRAKAVYSVSSCDGHNSASVKKIEYKLQTASSWSQGQANAASGTFYTFGDGGIAILNTYEVIVTVTDALGKTTTRTATVSSVLGYGFGLNGKSFRLGGPIQRSEGFENDYDYLGHDDVTVQKASGVTGFFAERTDTGVRVSLEVGTNGQTHGLYSYNSTGGNKWIIYRTLAGNTHLPDAPFFKGHNAPIGTIANQNPSSSSIANATWVTDRKSVV